MTKSTHSGIVRLSRIVVKGHINIEVNGGHGWKEYTTLPHADIDLSLGGMFIPCNQPPPSGEKVRITWTDPPFSRKTFKTTATLVETAGGIRLKFDQLSHADQHSLYDWMAHLEARLGYTPEDTDPAIRSSVWYTAAAAVSAGGLFLGAFAVLLQLVVGDRVNPLPLIMLAVMVFTILLFTVFRVLGGKWERKAIQQEIHTYT